MTMRTKRYQNSAALLIFMRRTTIFHFSFKRGFQTESKGTTPHGLTLNPEPLFSLFHF